MHDLSWHLNVRGSFEQAYGIAVGDPSIGHHSTNTDVRVSQAEYFLVG